MPTCRTTFDNSGYVENGEEAFGSALEITADLLFDEQLLLEQVVLARHEIDRL